MTDTEKDALDRLRAGKCSHGHGTTDNCTTCTVTLVMVAGINQMVDAMLTSRRPGTGR